MKSPLSFLALLVIVGMAVSSCGGNGPKPGAEDVAVEVKSKELTPVEVGEKISNLYSQALEEVGAIVKDSPPASEVGPALAQLKEKYVQELVELGKKREAMEDADRSKVDLNIRIGLQALYGEPVYTAYSEAVTKYFPDEVVRELLADFNIITQYANFELLKQQEPEEAARLGIQ